MNTQEIIDRIHTAKKKTPVKVYLQVKEPIPFPESCKVFGGPFQVVFGEWADIAPVLESNKDSIIQYEVENDRRNSAIPLLDLKNINARIEPGVTIRECVEIGDNAVIMMGAVINIGAVIGEGTMIDMGCVLGGRATVGKNCHIGAGTVLAIVFPLLYCLIDGLGTFADALLLDRAIAETQANIAYELTFLFMAVCAFIYVVIIKKQKITLSKEKPKMVAALCETAGQFAYVFAIGANAIVAAPMISSYCIASLLWSRLLLKEKLSKAQYLVIAIAAVGIVILGQE